MGTLNLNASSAARVTLKATKATGASFSSLSTGSYLLAHATAIQVAGATPAGPTLTNLFVLDLSGVGITDNSNVSVSYASASGGGYDVFLNAGTSSAPEPATAALAGLSATTLLGLRPRRRDAKR